jgi:hypothetical protein
MTNNEFDEFLDEDDDSPIEDMKLDIEKIKKLIPTYSNEKLCEMIVCDRYFGFGEKFDTFCMEELAKRRVAGDTFNFESYIAQAQSELPVLDFTAIPDLRTIMNEAIGRKINNR